MTQPTAWSYSRIESSETCPRKYWHLNVAKDLKEPESIHQVEGTETHAAFEAYLRKGEPLPIHLRHHTRVLDSINRMPVTSRIIEQQIALDANWQVVDWFSKTAWVRAKSDLTQINGTVATVWDWKTGKQKDDFTQLKLNAAITMHLAPEIDKVMMAYYWTKSRNITKDVITRGQLPEFWGEMLVRVQTFQSLYDRQDFPPRPNYFCKGCIVKSCQYWQPKKGS
jgi:PD-(D/E)XK nuclease superfamily